MEEELDMRRRDVELTRRRSDIQRSTRHVKEQLKTQISRDTGEQFEIQISYSRYR
jgi:hypothetical protein